jgi:hypothetical protein
MKLNEAKQILKKAGYLLEDSGEVYPPNIADRFKKITQEYIKDLPLYIDEVTDDEAHVEYKKKGEQVILLVRNGNTKIRCLIDNGDTFFEVNDIDDYETKIRQYRSSTTKKPLDYWLGNLSSYTANKLEKYIKTKYPDLFDEEGESMLSKEEFKKLWNEYRKN